MASDSAEAQATYMLYRRTCHLRGKEIRKLAIHTQPPFRREIKINLF